MDFRKIEYFIKVAEFLNFSRAADEIYISHQALSKQIRSLEEELGVALFERTTSKVVLTETGRKLYQAFKPIVESAYREYDTITKFIELRRSNLSLGYFNALSYPNIVEPIIRFLKSRKPELAIDVSAGDVGEVRDKLIEDKLDLLITTVWDLGKWESVRYIVLDTFPLRIIISSNHPWYGRKKPVTAKELETESLLHYKTGDLDFMQQMKVAKRIPIQNYDTYINRLYTGMEIGVIADIYSQREGQFRLLDLPEEYQSDMHLIAAYKKEHPLKDLFRQLLTYKKCKT